MALVMVEFSLVAMVAAAMAAAYQTPWKRWFMAGISLCGTAIVAALAIFPHPL